MPIANLRPGAIGTNDGWTLLAGSTKVSAVDLPDDDSTSYIYGPSDGDLQSFSISAASIPPGIGVVNAVNGKLRAFMDTADPGTPTASFYLRIGGSTTFGSSRTLTGAWTTYTDASMAKPGGGGWLPGDISTSVEVGVKRDANDFPYATSIYAELDYQSGAGGLVFLLLSLGPLVAVGLDRMPSLASALWRARRIRFRQSELAEAYRALRAYRHPRVFCMR